MKEPILFFIRFYRRITVWFRLAQVPGPTYTPCRFYPPCSEYAELAVRKYGTGKGSWKAIGRIIRCNPFASGGVDYP
ncbi:MAG: membrane protein insertion efficiency factor YidD [Patescibacteria group bacterium]